MYIYYIDLSMNITEKIILLWKVIKMYLLLFIIFLKIILLWMVYFLNIAAIFL